MAIRIENQFEGNLPKGAIEQIESAFDSLPRIPASANSRSLAVGKHGQILLGRNPTAAGVPERGAVVKVGKIGHVTGNRSVVSEMRILYRGLPCFD